MEGTTASADLDSTAEGHAGAPGPTPDEAAPHLMVIDDDRRLRTLLRKFLSDNGFRVTAAPSAAEARAEMDGLVFDAIVLDLMMPGESGFEFLESLRKTSRVPVLMLTARSEIDNRINGLELGADDYLAKPFEPRELLLRINNILRRQAEAGPPGRPSAVVFGTMTFNLDRGDLIDSGTPVRITERERDFLRALSEAMGDVVSRYDLVDEGSAGSERAVDVQINRLRRKLERDPGNPVYLQTVRGVGYRLMVDEWLP